MSIPYRKSPRPTTTQCAAYIDIAWIASTHIFYGAVLIIDAHGQPLEFVHNTLDAPSGFLWPEEQVRAVGIAALCHSLFEACTREPELLICSEAIGAASYCRAALDPVVPFAQALQPSEAAPSTWAWINNPPSQSMPAYSMAETLRSRGFAMEPFERIQRGLRELYPDVPWGEGSNDPVKQAR